MDQTTPKIGTPKGMKVGERLNGERKVSVGMEGDKRGVKGFEYGQIQYV